MTTPLPYQPFVTRPDQLDSPLFAEWIIPAQELGVFCFRKQFNLDVLPGSYIVHVSADARYRLYVNGCLVCWGPALGDVQNWHYETVDLAPFLSTGNNVIAAQVWNWGRLNGARQQSARTAFILQGDSPAEQDANTNRTWKVMQDAAYSALEMTDALVGGGYIAGGTEQFDARSHPWGWIMPGFDDSAWSAADEIGKGNHNGLDTWKGTPWQLTPRTIPFMEETPEPSLHVLDVRGIPWTNTDTLPNFEIPPHSRAEILLDNRVLTMGFPILSLSGGRDSRIEIRYQESLFDSAGHKGNRDEWRGKIMKGCFDILIADGGERVYEPLWVRIFRYIKLTIETADEALAIHSVHHRFTAYPFQRIARFDAKNDLLKRFWDVSWRTLRLCSLETYVDCPYYEHQQYIGDARIAALLSIYVTGDDRLAKNAIRQFSQSIQPMGLTKSAHPNRGIQIIPPFSLLYIGMIHDYYMLRDAPDFIRPLIPGVRFILDWFISRIDESGMLGPMPYWHHVDAGTGFPVGSPPGASQGGSAHMTILLAYALDRAAELCATFGYPCDAKRFQEISTAIKKKTIELCFCNDKQLIAETPEKRIFSQHTNLFAILTDTLPVDDQPRLMRSLLTDATLIQTTPYFKFYLFQAMKKVGMGADILQFMGEWENFLAHGLTTFPEHGLDSRSDCHVWAAHLMYDFLNILCGIAPGSPGFKSVEIQPNFGNLAEVTASVPHPNGEIHLHYQRIDDQQAEIQITLPENIPGTLLLHGQTFHLSPAEQHSLRIRKNP